MKICPICKTVNSDDTNYCTKCKEYIAREPVMSSKEDVQEKSSQTQTQIQTSIFVDQSETIVASIGSNYLQNFLTGQNVSKGVGILTQKRFYYKGLNFAGQGKEMASSTDEGVVSLEDITFTQFTHTEKTGYLMFGILLAVVGCMLFAMLPGFGPMIGGIALAASLPFFIMYFTNRQTLFVVSFPGGGFSFNVSWYPIADFRDFQRQLHLLKDQLKNG